MTMPNFLIIGAAKAGTTSLSNYLQQHPEIYMSSRKEPKFFLFEGKNLNPSDPIDHKAINQIDDYLSLFQNVSSEKAIGEVSPAYITSPEAAKRIQFHIPNVKLVAILRDPSERAYSHFIHMIQKGIEPLSDFAKALHEDEHYIGGYLRKRPYVRMGFYYAQLKPYFEIFDRNQIQVLLFDDLRINSTKLLKEIFGFLEVDTSFLPNNLFKYNASGIPKNKTINYLVARSNPFRTIAKSFLPRQVRQYMLSKVQNQNYIKSQLPQEIRQYLIQIYRQDILQLQDLINRDLSHWLT